MNNTSSTPTQSAKREEQVQGRILQGRILESKSSDIEKITQSGSYRIFITHSQADTEGKEFFQKIFSQTNTAGFWYSDHKIVPPHSEKIINTMRMCSSVFVILSPEMENPYTTSWVSFEIGVAKALGKNVWVFENPERPENNVLVPGADAYIHRPAKINNVEDYGYMKIINTGGIILPKSMSQIRVTVGHAKPVLINNVLDPNQFGHIGNVTCGNKKCKQSFFRATLKGFDSYKCPACRQPMRAKN